MRGLIHVFNAPVYPISGIQALYLSDLVTIQQGMQLL